MGTTVFDEIVPFSLIAAIKAGMRTGLGNWAIGYGHDKCYLGNLTWNKRNILWSRGTLLIQNYICTFHEHDPCINPLY